MGRTGIWSELLASPASKWREVIADASGPPEDRRRAVRPGGFPVPSLLPGEDRDRWAWFDGYVKTYLERDLPELRAVENLGDFRRSMRAAALRTGSLLNQAEPGRDVGLSQVQVRRFLSLPEAGRLVVRPGSGPASGRRARAPGGAPGKPGAGGPPGLAGCGRRRSGGAVLEDGVRP